MPNTGNITNFLEAKLLEHCLGRTAYTMPTTVHAALFLVTPTDAGGGTEVTGTGYARVPTSWNPASVGPGTITNSIDIRFPSVGGAGGSWGTVVALALFDASVNGNMLWYGPLSTSVVVNIGDDFRIAAGQLTLSLD